MIELRAFERTDAPTVASWIDDLDALVTWSGRSGFAWPFDGAQLLAFRDAHPAHRLLIATDTGGRATGHFMLRPEEPGSVRLGMVLVSPAARGKGYGLAMLKAALGTAFADPGVRRVGLAVYAHNRGAARLYERLGFREEEVDAKSIQVGEDWWTSITMGLSREVWNGA
ncbi:GNAT family protein [Nonomuraea sp. NPDC050643]|uniref:GNAT family N-acetyltransferase n=1 Tax=Nonomuraea sp. NPDC050643 TaxID=3155660 RepID=UPI0033EE5E53